MGSDTWGVGFGWVTFFLGTRAGFGAAAGFSFFFQGRNDERSLYSDATTVATKIKVPEKVC